MSDLSDRRCEPCEGSLPPLTAQQIKPLRAQLDPQWEVVDNHHLVRAFKFPDFVAALEFTNRVGRLAEQQQHHPDIHLSYGKATVEIWTHKIGGLSENDFILAAKIDKLGA